MNIHYAKTNLSRLLAKVEAGEEVIIARNGKQIARLVSVEPKSNKRVLGQFRDQIVIHDNFDDPVDPETWE